MAVLITRQADIPGLQLPRMMVVSGLTADIEAKLLQGGDAIALTEVPGGVIPAFWSPGAGGLIKPDGTTAALGGSGVPDGGDTGWALRKNSAANGDASWQALPPASIPTSTWAARGTGVAGDMKVITDFFRYGATVCVWSTTIGDWTPTSNLDVLWRLPFDGASKSAELVSLITQMQAFNANRGGTIHFPIGDVILNNCTLTPTQSNNITLAGACSPHAETPVGGTRLVSQTGFGVLRITGVAIGNRVHNLNLRDLTVRGAGDQQDLIICERSSRVRWERCHFNNTTGRAVLLREAWDGWGERSDATFCGGPTRPVYEFNSPGAGYDFTNQYWLVRCRNENNQGVDVAITGDNTNEVYIHDLKAETSTSALPRITVDNNAVNIELKSIQATFGGNTNPTDIIRIQNARMVRGTWTAERSGGTAVPVNYVTVLNCAQVELYGQVAPGQPAPSSGAIYNWDGLNVASNDIQCKHEWPNVKTFAAARGPSRGEVYLGAYINTAAMPTNGSVPTHARALDISTGLMMQWTGTAYVDEIGYRGISLNPLSAAYTILETDAGKMLLHPAADTAARTWTIPSNAAVAFPLGTTLTFDNDVGAGALTIAITTDTLVLVGAAGGTGSRTLAAGGRAVAIKVGATRWRISGTAELT